MGFQKTIILFSIFIFICETALPQEPPVIKDSTQLYKDIETYSKRGRFTKFIYRLVFKPAASPKKSTKKRGYKKLIQKPYSAFEGKTIRHINIETLDPFGYSIADTNAVPKNFLLMAGNKIHVKSQQIAIRNLLLIRQNQRFDSLLVKESERLVRTRNYIHDVSFFVKATSKNSDSVDIFIRELDKWSLIPRAGISNSGFSINLTDKNFLGFGHESSNGIAYNPSDYFAYKFNYFIPNIRNTYIQSTLHVSNDKFRNSARSFTVDRPFFSPYARWAGGLSIGQFGKDSIYNNDSILTLQRLKFMAQDYWAGGAIRVFKGSTENKRTTNLVAAIRFLRIRYFEKPVETNENQDMFSDENFYLASIGISTRKHVQDRYIFRYGITEDVPIGKVYNITGGYQVNDKFSRLYLGLRLSVGNYHEWGYLSSNFEYGTFFRGGHAEQGAFTVGINYFTGLIEVGKWKLRQFIKPQATFGINRLNADSISLNEGYGLEGFNSTTLSGTNRLLLTLQTQSYAPWSLIGFSFGPFLNFSMGMLGNEASGFKGSKVYTQIGLGVLIKNENLVFITFQISFAFYPLIPGKGRDIFKMNSFRTTDFGFRDFEIGKPAILEYQ